MPIAAVPEYLGQNFETASPGMRFGIYLPMWTNRTDQEREVKERSAAKSKEGFEVEKVLQQGMDHAIDFLCRSNQRPLPRLWQKNDSGSREAWKQVIRLTANDQKLMHQLGIRQSAQALQVSSLRIFTLRADSIAPFTTGLGNEHPLDNGFAFLNPYGLPYLPASGVKGVLRHAARELASAAWGDTFGWSTQHIHELKVGRQSVKLSDLDALFGLESDDGDSIHVRGALTFWDVIPQLKDDKLAVDIMTPHQSHYYQNKPAAGSTTPHDSGQPNPISFLTVPPGSGFTFHVVCDLDHLRRIAPELCTDEKWRAMLDAAFRHAFDWLGFGAKTAVGYGAMQEDPEVARKRAAQAAEVARKSRAEAEERLQREKVEAEAGFAREKAETAALRERERQDALALLSPGRRFLTISSEELQGYLQLPEAARVAPAEERLRKAFNAWTDTAHTWPDSADRADAADLLIRFYETLGWHEKGVDKQKREKQTRKKQDRIAAIRTGVGDKG